MTVFVVQEQLKFNAETGVNEPRFPSIERASSFGPIVYMLEPNAHPFAQASVVAGFHKFLSTFCDDDYLILVGNPILIGMATAIASSYNSGRVKFLQWSSKNERYILVESVMY